MIVSIKDTTIARELCKGKTLVATLGTFDLLHMGHIGHLEHCKNMGDNLIVLLSDDSSVKRKKGSDRPIIHQDQRARILDSLKVVDFVIIGCLDDQSGTRIASYIDILKCVRPQIFVVKNPGWGRYRAKLYRLGIELRIEKETVRLSGTTEIINTIIDRYVPK